MVGRCTSRRLSTAQLTKNKAPPVNQRKLNSPTGYWGDSMTVLLVIAIWTGVSALLAPAIGHLLFSLSVAYPVAHPARLAPIPRSISGRAFARRRILHNSATRKPIVQSKFG
jgi:hypothetical protein